MAVDVVIGLDSLALVLAIGLTLTQSFIVPAVGINNDELDHVHHTALRLYWLCLVALWLTSVAWLWTRTAAMSGQPLWAAWSVIPTVLFRTHFGAVWWLRAVALMWTTGVLVRMSRTHERADKGTIALLLIGLAWVAASRSAAGHAAADGDWTLREGMDWLHLMAISAWGGSLLASLLLIFPRLRHVAAQDQALFAARFSLFATVALACVLISGIYSSWYMLPGVSAFWTSYYGRLLGVKLLFVGGMVACGALNHYRLVPRLRTAVAKDNVAIAAVRQFHASVFVESVLLLFVLSVTVVLLGSMPPGM